MSSKRTLGPSLTSKQERLQLLALILQNVIFHRFHIFHIYDGDPSDEIRGSIRELTSNEGDGANENVRKH